MRHTPLPFPRFEKLELWLRTSAANFVTIGRSSKTCFCVTTHSSISLQTTINVPDNCWVLQFNERCEIIVEGFVGCAEEQTPYHHTSCSWIFLQHCFSNFICIQWWPHDISSEFQSLFLRKLPKLSPELRKCDSTCGSHCVIWWKGQRKGIWNGRRNRRCIILVLIVIHRTFIISSSNIEETFIAFFLSWKVSLIVRTFPLRICV